MKKFPVVICYDDLNTYFGFGREEMTANFGG
jgi:hypothetical protein